MPSWTSPGAQRTSLAAARRLGWVLVIVAAVLLPVVAGAVPAISSAAHGGSLEAGASIEGRILARRLSTGRVEFGFRPEGEALILPTRRFFPTDERVDRWLVSSEVASDGEVVGRITARLRADGRIEFGFNPVEGERVLPRGRFFPTTARVNRWLVSTIIEVPLVPETATIPDLVVGAPSVDGSSPSPGGSFTLSAAVRNQGSGESGPTTLTYYRSDDSTITPADTEVGTDPVPGLAASGSSAESTLTYAPSTPGTYYYGACADPAPGEYDTANNCSSSVAVTVLPPPPTTTAETDRAALIALYNATDGPNWNKSTNWLSDMPLSTWHGVFTHNGRVVWLDLGVMFGDRGEPLGSNNLSGTIPAEIGNLTNLKVLRLQDNNLSGPIPAEIGNLTNLEQLQLQDNSLSGTIPPEIGNLTNLEHLYLYKNDLTGSIPAEIGDLAGLVRLSLFYNDLEAGPIPVEFHKLVNLEALTLDTRHCAPQELEPWLRMQRFDVFPCTGPEENRLLPRVLLREDSEGLSLALDDDLHDPLMVNVSDKAVVTVAIQNGWLMLSPRGRGEAEVEIVPRSGGTPATATVLVREAVGTFGIDVVMAQPTTDLFAETMAEAADRWSTVLNGTEWNGRDARDYCEDWKNNVPVSSSGNELVIWAVRETDRSYSAGATGWGCRRGEGRETEPSHYYPVAGIITVNARLAHSSGGVGLIRHEIGHVLGLTGSFPPATGLVAEDWKYFVGPRAVAVFREGGGDPDLPGIPLSGRGHWSPGGPDVMVLPHNSDALSVAALADAGYTVDMSKTIPWRHGW